MFGVKNNACDADYSGAVGHCLGVATMKYRGAGDKRKSVTFSANGFELSQIKKIMDVTGLSFSEVIRKSVAAVYRELLRRGAIKG